MRGRLKVGRTAKGNDDSWQTLRCPWDCVIEALNEIHPASEQLIVRNVLRGPSTEYLVQRVSFRSPELSVFEVGIVYRLRNGEDLVIGYIECEAQRFKRASVTFMAKTGTLKHVKR